MFLSRTQKAVAQYAFACFLFCYPQVACMAQSGWVSSLFDKTHDEAIALAMQNGAEKKPIGLSFPGDISFEVHGDPVDRIVISGVRENLRKQFPVDDEQKVNSRSNMSRAKIGGSVVLISNVTGDVLYESFEVLHPVIAFAPKEKAPSPVALSVKLLSKIKKAKLANMSLLLGYPIEARSGGYNLDYPLKGGKAKLTLMLAPSKSRMAERTPHDIIIEFDNVKSANDLTRVFGTKITQKKVKGGSPAKPESALNGFPFPATLVMDGKGYLVIPNH